MLLITIILTKMKENDFTDRFYLHDEVIAMNVYNP